ncbi:nucleotide exchange factor GrpE [Megamonas hypermegale]|uniref:nucleotide exchange factor GrpE n=1 Tax=Megamonas hypermegale TaxID=158847 RepID=UPI0026EF7545|nr:nucleotide exchange factor GrpE [Megamonas hypermegale]
MTSPEENKTTANETTEQNEANKAAVQAQEAADTDAQKSPADEATDDLEAIKKELEAQKTLLQESEEHYKRLQADFMNFRRRNEKEREELSSVIVQGLIKDLLPIIDNFERALAVEEAKGSALHDGITMIYNQLIASLQKNGLEEIKAAGEKFDPNFHQAVMRVEDPEKEDNTVEEVLQKGYTVQGRVIRPSMVKVVAN